MNLASPTRLCSVSVFLLLSLAVPAGADRQADDALVFQSFWGENYRSQYAVAYASILGASTGSRDPDRLVVESRLRAKCSEWADALAETLVLKLNGEFSFVFRDIDEAPTGEEFLVSTPVGSQVTRSGTWSRDGRDLELHVRAVNGRELAEPFVWRGEWGDGEIRFPQWRRDGMTFGSSILIPSAAAGARSQDDRIARIEELLHELQGQVAAILKHLGSMRNDEAAVVALEKRETQDLIETLHGGNAEVAFSSALELGRGKARDAVAHLANILVESDDAILRFGAAHALGAIQSANGVSALIEVLADDDLLVSDEASKSLSVIVGRRCKSPRELDTAARVELRREWQEWWRENEHGVRQRLEGS